MSYCFFILYILVAGSGNDPETLGLWDRWETSLPAFCCPSWVRTTTRWTKTICTTIIRKDTLHRFTDSNCNQRFWRPTCYCYNITPWEINGDGWENRTPVVKWLTSDFWRANVSIPVWCWWLLIAVSPSFRVWCNYRSANPSRDVSKKSLRWPLTVRFRFANT